ncbi:ArsR/SmtB family transcription factor [Thermostaphylospora chromogena]|uniref:DNA-binding transcriptional regulator, ArsR family n=1 Tax=Thermostaphylospora chromogena TaxID=35622 RepID=A0A1H1AUQ7_9ACTN|nr:metalloregulator ArsR/SmtB family transcription factor [Thermostaphylospora chromogena]SDQ43382.1 DNA-binding transcriptional regulator, ArsR family [Thermostaphylospora chromogena]
MRNARHPAPDEISLTEVMAALSDPIRVGLVRLLADGAERGWGELRAPVAKSTLSHHLRILRDAGLTRTRQEGTRCYVRLRTEDLQARFPGLLPAVLAAARADDVGHHVTLAPPCRTTSAEARVSE